MKTYHLKDLLKKELLIVEWQDDYEIVGKIIFGKSTQKGVLTNLFNLDGYTLLGKPDEIKEEDAMGFVENCDFYNNFYKGKDYVYKNYGEGFSFPTATESLLSALEIEIYWENPLNNKLDKSQPLIIQTEHLSKWKEAQEKTFNRNRTLIFVKN